MRVSKIKHRLIYLVIITTLIMYVPIVYNSNLIGIFRYAVYGLMACLTFLTVSWNSVMKCRFTKIISLSLFVVFFEVLFFISFQLNYVLDDFLQLVIVLLMIIVGMNSSLDGTSLEKLCLTFSIGTIFIGFLAVISYLGSISFMNNAYAIEGKNQLGVLVALGAGVSFYLSQSNLKRSKFYLILSLIGVALSLLIRCRTATIGLGLFLLFMILVKFNRVQKFLIFLSSFFLLIIFYDEVYDFLMATFFKDIDIEGSANSGDLFNQLSTSRIERNIMAIDFLEDNLITGELFDLSGIPLIHNYVLLRLVRYGVFALPLLFIYFFFLIKFIKSLIKRHFVLLDMGWALLIIPMFCSLLEPSAPFGPGTIQLMPYLLCGVALKNESKK